MLVEKLQNELFVFEDKEYAEFNRKLCPDTKRDILGIRLPVLRKIAKEFVKDEDYIKYLDEALNITEDKYFEEVILQGMIIGYGKMELACKISYLKSFIPKIDSWAITDTVIPTLKLKDKDLEEGWKFILPYSKSKEEIRYFIKAFKKRG